MEMFLLDTRQYRDHNFGIDSPEIEKLGQKTMLGREQLVWLKEGLVNSGATWKIIVSSVPISIPTGADAERDGWCSGNCETCDTGFESEFAEILTTLKDNKLDNLWITTDVHFASAFKYTPWEGENYSVHEIVTGPLNAGLFPK
jgi:alkaline phosphatase D